MERISLLLSKILRNKIPATYVRTFFPTGSSIAFHNARADAACALPEKWKQSGAKNDRSTDPSGFRGMMVWSKKGCKTTVKSSRVSYLYKK